MLNTKLLLLILPLLSSIAAFEAYRHRQEVAQKPENKQFWDKGGSYRQKEAQEPTPKKDAKDALRYRVPKTPL